MGEGEKVTTEVNILSSRNPGGVRKVKKDHKVLSHRGEKRGGRGAFPCLFKKGSTTHKEGASVMCEPLGKGIKESTSCEDRLLSFPKRKIKRLLTFRNTGAEPLRIPHSTS